MNRFIQYRCASTLTVLLLLFSISATADTATIDPEADKILRSMSSFLGSLSSFSMKASIENELVTDGGQKLQLIVASDEIIPSPPYKKDASFNLGKHVLHFGEKYDSYLLIPKMP